MVRRSTVDRSPQPAGYAEGFDAGTENLAESGGVTRHRSAQTWRGAGGRWLVWLLRGVVWLVLLVIGYRGVTAIVFNETPGGQSSGAVSAPPVSFPVELAAAYVWHFGQVYLNATPRAAAQRAQELAQFLPAGADPQGGWNGVGSLHLQSEQVAGVQVRDAHHAIVTLLARVNGNLMGLGVPVYTDHGRMAVAGPPAWLPAPARATVPPAPQTSADTATQTVLANQLPAFFQAYASGDRVTLARFLVPGTTIAGLDGHVTFGSLTGVTVPPGGATRDITATVTWRVPEHGTADSKAAGSQPAQLEMTYALTIVRQQGTWYVKHISPSSQAWGP